MASTYGISKIYLATDDPHALSELQTALDSQTSGLSVVGQVIPFFTPCMCTRPTLYVGKDDAMTSVSDANSD